MDSNLKKKCTRCKETKKLDGFHVSNVGKDGHHTICKPCRNAYKRKANKEKWATNAEYRKKVLAQLRLKNLKIKAISDSLKRGGCVLCGEKELCCLDFHHLTPETKRKAMSALRGSERIFLEEAEKCIVVCSNCHRKIHN